MRWKQTLLFLSILFLLIPLAYAGEWIVNTRWSIDSRWRLTEYTSRGSHSGFGTSYSVTVYVNFDNGSAVENALVSLSGKQNEAVWTGTDGKAFFYSLPYGDYSVTVTYGEYKKTESLTLSKAETLTFTVDSTTQVEPQAINILLQYPIIPAIIFIAIVVYVLEKEGKIKFE